MQAWEKRAERRVSAKLRSMDSSKLSGRFILCATAAWPPKHKVVKMVKIWLCSLVVSRFDRNLHCHWFSVHKNLSRVPISSTLSQKSPF